MNDYIITVDFGGTKILTALLSKENKIIDRIKTPTNLKNGANGLVDDIASSIKILMENTSVSEKQITAIAMGVPGTVNPESGIIGVAPNLGIENYNIKKALQKYFSVPVLIENDVNLAGLGIKRFEFDNNVNNMLIVFVGTGIGSALIFNGQLYRGSSFYAGEIGHIKVDRLGNFSSKSKTTFEQTASRTAIVENIKREINAGKKSRLLKTVKKGKKIKSGLLAKAIQDNDKLVISEMGKGCRVIGRVLGSITTLLNLDTIVLGGGVIEAAGDFMLPKIKSAFDEAVLPGPGKAVKIVVTELGDDAPLYGGVALVEEFENKK